MILDLILIGLAVALDPLPLSAFLIVLPSKGGARKGAAFVFGVVLVAVAIRRHRHRGSQRRPKRPPR